MLPFLAPLNRSAGPRLAIGERAWLGGARCQTALDGRERGVLAVVLNEAACNRCIVEAAGRCAGIEAPSADQGAELERGGVQRLVALTPRRGGDGGAFLLDGSGDVAVRHLVHEDARPCPVRRRRGLLAGRLWLGCRRRHRLPEQVEQPVGCRLVPERQFGALQPVLAPVSHPAWRGDDVAADPAHVDAGRQAAGAVRYGDVRRVGDPIGPAGEVPPITLDGAVGLCAASNDTRYSDELAKAQTYGADVKAAHPYADTAGEVVGGIVGTATSPTRWRAWPRTRPRRRPS